MHVPAVCITGWSDSGKTTLIEGLIACLAKRGLRVSVLKHSHHPVMPDRAGSDTSRYLAAGAACAGFSGADGALIRFAAPTLQELLGALGDADLVLVEGYEKEAVLPMIEVWRDAKRPLRSPEAYRRALVTALPVETGLPVFAPEDIERIADFALALARKG